MFFFSLISHSGDKASYAVQQNTWGRRTKIHLFFFYILPEFSYVDKHLVKTVSKALDVAMDYVRHGSIEYIVFDRMAS